MLNEITIRVQDHDEIYNSIDAQLRRKLTDEIEGLVLHLGLPQWTKNIIFTFIGYLLLREKYR